MVRDLSVSTLHPRGTRVKWTPPFRVIPKWERRFWGVFFFVGILATPAYIMYNLPYYRGGVGPNKAYLRKMAKEQAN